MENWERDYLTSRIISGEHQHNFGSKTLFIKPINRNQKYQANLIYKDNYFEAKEMGIMTQIEALELLKNKFLWNDKKQEELDEHLKNQEENKIKIYESWGEDNLVFLLKENLKECNAKIAKLEAVKSSFDYMTCESIALSSKYRYMIGSSIYLSGEEPYWNSFECWNTPDHFIDPIIEWVALNRIRESEFRDLARNDPWKSYWDTRKDSGRGLFDCASVDLTDEQKILIAWSCVYESIHNHHEAPIDAIIQDDDALDGWLILQRRKAKEDAAKNRLKSIGDKVKNCDEVFVMAKSIEDIKLIDSLNKKGAKALKEQRLKEIADKGVVPEQLMSNTVEKNRIAMNRLILEKGK